MVNSPGQVLLQIACSRKALFTELTLPRLVFVVHSVNVHSHVVAPHEHLVALKGFKIKFFMTHILELWQWIQYMLGMKVELPCGFRAQNKCLVIHHHQ